MKPENNLERDAENSNVERVGEHWYDFDLDFLLKIKINPEENKLLIWDNKPEQGNKSIYFGQTGVQLTFGDWGDGLEWNHHFQPENRKEYSPDRLVKYVRFYASGMLLLLNWFRDEEFFKTTSGQLFLPDSLKGQTNKKMWLFRQKILGQENAILQDVYGSDGEEDYWYYLNLKKMLDDKQLEDRLLKIASH